MNTINKKNREKSFIIIIGSVSRKDFEINSDIDICRINSEMNIERLESWPQGPISYIDYEWSTFFNLYEMGSLFLYHIFNEGLLLEGDIIAWEGLKRNFKLKKDFKEELEDTKEILTIFSNVEAFGYSYISFYANLLTHIKNFSIFLLANNEEFIFNKRISIANVFGNTYSDVLIDSFNYMKRNVGDIPNYEYYSVEKAKEILNFYVDKVEDLYNENYANK